MNISELKSTLSLSDLLIVGYVGRGEVDVPTLTVGRVEKDNKFKILECFHGDTARSLYLTLTDIQKGESL